MSIRQRLLQSLLNRNPSRPLTAQSPDRTLLVMAEPHPASPRSSLLSEAFANLQDKNFLKSDRYQEQQIRAERSGASPIILDFEKRFVAKMAKMNIPVFAHEVMRSNERQQMLYVTGKSKAKAGQGAHPHGFAIDLIHSTKGWDLTKEQWGIFGHVGKEIAIQYGLNLQWGGEWKFYDPAHWECSDWKHWVTNRSKYEDSGGINPSI